MANNNKMIHNSTQVEEVKPEAGGVKEVEEIFRGNKVMADHVIIVESLGITCYYYGNPGHMQADCYKKRNDMRNGKVQQNNYASSSRNYEDNERLFVMQHVMNSVSADVASCKEDVWYVDSGASNHMTSHGEWFKEMKDPEIPGYVEAGDGTAHPIAHVGDVPLSMQDGKVKYLVDVLHVP